MISLSTEVSCFVTFVTEVFLLLLAEFFCEETEPTTFFTEVDLFAFFPVSYTFLGASSFLRFTPELFEAFGGALFGGMLAF